MDPASIHRHGQVELSVAGAVHARSGIVSTPTYRTRPRVTFADLHARNGRHVDRVLRVPVGPSL